MSKFFLGLKKDINVFEKTKRTSDQNTKTIVHEGLNYKGTKKFNAKELVLFIERDIYIASQEGEIPSLEIKTITSENNGGGQIFVNVIGIQIDDFYKKIKSSLPVASRDIFSNKHSFMRKFYYYIKQNLEQILWSYNYLKIVEGVSTQFRFKHGIHIQLDEFDKELLAKVDKVFDSYMAETDKTRRLKDVSNDTQFDKNVQIIREAQFIPYAEAYFENIEAD